VEIIRDIFDLRPKGLIAMLGLLKPIYQATAAMVILDVMKNRSHGKKQIKLKR